MKPKGKLIVIGGAVDKGSFTEKDYASSIEQNLNFFEKGILRRIINESANKEKSKILVIPTASQIPQVVGEEYVKAFTYLGASDITMLDIQDRVTANSLAVTGLLKSADVVMFTGGDQLRLTSILGGTVFHEILLDKYQHQDFLIAGTSAGAAAVSTHMIYQGSASEALLKGEIKITGGLGLLNDVVIDTHFVHRGRIGRLFQAVVSNPRVLGIGLGEDTGLLIKEGYMMEAIGSGLVILVDGKKIKNTNITEVQLGQPVSIENLVVHVLSQFDMFDLEKHEIQIHHSIKKGQKDDTKPAPRLIIHGGFFGESLTDPGTKLAKQEALQQIVMQGYNYLMDGHTALETVAYTAALLEDCELFNAGTGSQIQSDGVIRMSASIMDGITSKFAGVINIQDVRNPVLVAQKLLDYDDSVLGGAGATDFARQAGFEYYNTETPQRRLEYEVKREAEGKVGVGTIGCIALDANGDLAAATSTGGKGFEIPGRISDSATTAGNFVNEHCGVSCTGVGEDIIRISLASKIVTRVTDGMALSEAFEKTFAELKKFDGFAGAIAIDKRGNIYHTDSHPDMVYASYDGKILDVFG